MNNRFEQLFDGVGLLISWSLSLLIINITMLPILFSVVASLFVIVDKYQSMRERKRRNKIPDKKPLDE